MRTPAGKECKFFHGDYFRGRNHEECRLLKSHGLNWTPDLCGRCPVPDILLANACENMHFTPRIERPMLVFKPEVRIDTECVKCQCDVEEPRIGCGQCHPLPEVFVIAPDDNDTSP